jgi:hypothetical protein
MEQVKVDCAPVSVVQLANSDIEQMYTLFEQYYDCVSFDTFRKDLLKKDKVIVARSPHSGPIKGFTTLKIMDIEYDLNGKRCHATGVFSGDTIVSPEYWGSRVINGAFAATLLKEKAKHPFSPVYWFLISKGYKTYLLLTNNFLEYYPNKDEGTPEHIQKVIDTYAMTLYPEAYDQESGLLKFEQSLGQLKSSVAPIDQFLVSTQPKIAFFQFMNPDWQQGDELVCLGVVSWRLFAFYALKSTGIFLRKLVKRHPSKTTRRQTA